MAVQGESLMKNNSPNRSAWINPAIRAETKESSRFVKTKPIVSPMFGRARLSLELVNPLSGMNDSSDQSRAHVRIRMNGRDCSKNRSCILNSARKHPRQYLLLAHGCNTRYY